MKLAPYFSFIVPVYNRPNEIDELLNSMLELNYSKPFEIVIIEDGSTETSEEIVKKYSNRLLISYYYKNNTGPGDSRNYGMQKAKGVYFLILDSDVILPNNYLFEVEKALKNKFVDCFGGIDNAHSSFTDLQKAINSVMTSFLTTGGIRGGGEQLGKFQPRSFNMGLSKKAFKASAGFGKIHPGEDPDLSMRLWNLGFETALFNNVEVFHKRRISWSKFLIQVTKFGKCRPILNSWHKGSGKITYWFPTIFCVSVLVSLLLALASFYLPLVLIGIYVLLVFIEALFKYKSFKIAIMSVWAMGIQFYGYGKGFLISFVKIKIFGIIPEKAFPKLFFKS
ncbi:glycosyltransferase [Aquimarina agarivorans]|uniref:glycosyltransferase n=1 Tax=Aquimarina agarivorans TaxID=980584 RepID=UPI000248EB3F|nr:glycosyltransferase [Aquimarina agarivorans]